MATLSQALRAPAPEGHAPRKWQRVAVSVPADLVSPEGHRSVLVVNLCTYGAMVEMTVPPRPGSEVLLYCGGIEAEGSVVWQGTEHCGIAFHLPVPEDEIDVEAYWSRTSLERMLAAR